MLTHDFEEVRLVVVLDLVAAFGVILKQNKITDGDV